MKIIVFNIGETTYGVKMDNIKEIMPYPTMIAKLPNQKEFIIGVTNIRGKISVIVSLGKLFKTEHGEPKFLMVLEKGGKIVSFPTDGMPQTLDVNLNDMSNDFIGRSDYIDGIVDSKLGLVAILKEEELFHNNVKL